MTPPVLLLVEDCPDDQELMRLALKDGAFPLEVVMLSDGREALDRLRFIMHSKGSEETPHPALILLDLKLPGLSGLDFIRELRREPLGRLIPVVVLTTSGIPADIEAAYESGANAFVQKPMEYGALVRLVEALRTFWIDFNVLHPRLR